ncbi:MAG: hypothetical protein HY394_02585 [Candidatus Diapherotrites archaeon]|nr:hypothetical protein [Candidatus Diapherotrites archaeon]
MPDADFVVDLAGLRRLFRARGFRFKDGFWVNDGTGARAGFDGKSRALKSFVFFDPDGRKFFGRSALELLGVHHHDIIHTLKSHENVQTGRGELLVENHSGGFLLVPVDGLWGIRRKSRYSADLGFDVVAKATAHNANPVYFAGNTGLLASGEYEFEKIFFSPAGTDSGPRLEIVLSYRHQRSFDPERAPMQKIPLRFIFDGRLWKPGGRETADFLQTHKAVLKRINRNFSVDRSPGWRIAFRAPERHGIAKLFGRVSRRR